MTFNDPMLMKNLIFAHAGHSGGGADLLHGFAHPFSGLDHLLAMVAVGVFAAMLGGRAIWLVPLSFLGLMAIGGALGIAGVAVPFLEQGIGGSVLVLGVLIAVAAKVPVVAAASIVGFFALFHGVAHGGEMPFSSSGLEYGVGFIAATALLHIAGIALGITFERFSPPVIVRAAGAAVAIIGGFMLAGLM